MGQGLGGEAPRPHTPTTHRRPARFQVVIDSGGFAVARLFLASRAQVAELTTRRGRITPAIPLRIGDPTDAAAALAAYEEAPSAITTAQLWLALRWNRRHIGVRAALLAATSPDDPRHRIVIGELVALASDADSEVGRAAVNALHAVR